MALQVGLPAESYTSEAAWQRDREQLVLPGWWVVAHQAEIPDRGDVVPFTIAGTPLLVVQAGIDRVRVFLNACRHRAGPLIWPEERLQRQPRLRCRYHGWQYDLTGKLVATPQFGAPCPDLSLVEVPSVVWRGLVFACPGGQPAEPADVLLAALRRTFDDRDLEDLQLHSRSSHELACDWKVYVENYLEGYHIPFAHPGLAKEVRLSDYTVHIDGPVVEHRVAPRTEDAVSAGCWAWAWPGLALNVYAGGLCVERMVPVARGRTRLDYLYLFAADRSPGDRARSIATSQEVTEEDRRLVEAVQRGLGAGIDPGPLSPRHEQGLVAFHQRVREGWSRISA